MRKGVGEDFAGFGLGHTKGAANVDRCFGLRIKGLLLVEPAWQVDLNHTQGTRLELFASVHRHCSLIGSISRLQSEQIAHGQPERAQHTGLNSLTTWHRTETGASGAISVRGIHHDLVLVLDRLFERK